MTNTSLPATESSIHAINVNNNVIVISKVSHEACKTSYLASREKLGIPSSLAVEMERQTVGAEGLITISFAHACRSLKSAHHDETQPHERVIDDRNINLTFLLHNPR